MARFRKPYFKKSHEACVNLDGKNVRLSADKDEAHERYLNLMRERKKAAPATLGHILGQLLASAFKGKFGVYVVAVVGR
jgi:hypothetical protein